MSDRRDPRQEPSVPEEKRPVLYLAEYETPNRSCHAAEKVRDAGYKSWDVHTPFPIHGMDNAMGLSDSKLGWIVLICGMTGLTGGFAPHLVRQRHRLPHHHRRQAARSRSRPWCRSCSSSPSCSPPSARSSACSPQQAAAAPPPDLRLGPLRGGDGRQVLHLDRGRRPKFDLDEDPRAARVDAPEPPRDRRGGGVL
jgi:hypothetical protein